MVWLNRVRIFSIFLALQANVKRTFWWILGWTARMCWASRHRQFTNLRNTTKWYLTRCDTLNIYSLHHALLMYTIIYNLSCKLHHRYSIAVVSVCVCSRIHTVIHIEPTNRTGGGNVSNNFHRWGGAMNERDASCSLIRVCYNRISIFFFIFGANICNCAYCCTDYLLFFFSLRLPVRTHTA